MSEKTCVQTRGVKDLGICTTIPDPVSLQTPQECFFVGNWLAGCCIPPFIRILGLKPRFLIPQVSAGEVGRKDGEPFFTLFVFYRGSG
jgi:hypothetical protein